MKTFILQINAKDNLDNIEKQKLIRKLYTGILGDENEVYSNSFTLQGNALKVVYNAISDISKYIPKSKNKDKQKIMSNLLNSLTNYLGNGDTKNGINILKTCLNYISKALVNLYVISFENKKDYGSAPDILGKHINLILEQIAIYNTSLSYDASSIDLYSDLRKKENEVPENQDTVKSTSPITPICNFTNNKGVGNTLKIGD
ncbi:hypothetical protein L3V86_08215 [Thiotrichales bacterium 19S11-10]|nr:hypothetical protein [Thiotrichales bacterium 19S11-10]